MAPNHRGLFQHSIIIFAEGCRLMEPPPSGTLPVSGAWIKALGKSYLRSNRLLPTKDLYRFCSLLAKSKQTSMSNFGAWNVPGKVGGIISEHP